MLSLTFTQAVSLVFLASLLVLAIWQRLNIGMLALAAALPILALSHASVTVLYQAFPGNLFVLIAGVTLLFAHLERSGALAVVVTANYSGIGERHWLLPCAGFAIACAMSTAGAFSTAPIAFLVPMIAAVSVNYRSTFYVCELAVVIGANASGLSPLNPTGAVVRTAANKFHVEYSGLGLSVVGVGVAVVVVLGLQQLDFPPTSAWPRLHRHAGASRDARRSLRGRHERRLHVVFGGGVGRFCRAGGLSED